MIEIYCEKLYKYSRIEEPVSVTIPFKKGAYTKTEDMAVLQNGSPVLIQPKVTARYDDGSIRYLFCVFWRTYRQIKQQYCNLMLKQKPEPTVT